MIQDIFYKNEIEYARSLFLKNKSDFRHYVIVGEDDNYIFRALKDMFSSVGNASFFCNPQECIKEKYCVICVLHGAKEKETILKSAEKIILADSCERCVVFDDNTLSVNDNGFLISEREYVVLNKDKTTFYKLKDFVKNTETLLLISDRVFGPGFGFEEMFGEISLLNKVKITDADKDAVYGFTYIRDVLASVILALKKLKNGNIYNVSSFTGDFAEIKQSLYENFKDKFSLECSLSAMQSKGAKALCNLKLCSSGFTPMPMKKALYLSASSYFNFEYDYNKNLPQYCSKLDTLKKIELDILKEINRICSKHNIKYFLTGGTLLGAVRYKKSIPWDDDLDIGMLREDFEKFRKVCPQEIDKTKFAYASYTTEANCHYLFDKIRLKNTYFSTKFSSDFNIQDGVFVDIFVYDNTSPSAKMQKIHINLIKTAIRFLNIKWTGKADRNMNGYKLSLIMKPFVKLMTFGMLHSFAERSLKFFSKKNSVFLVDGTGLNINRGAFEKSYLEKLSVIEFEGVSVPVPENYDGFLKHVYGENYLEEPPVFMRDGTHDFVRLDLGEYIVDGVTEANEQSLDGELF